MKQIFRFVRLVTEMIRGKAYAFIAVRIKISGNSQEQVQGSDIGWSYSGFQKVTALANRSLQYGTQQALADAVAAQSLVDRDLPYEKDFGVCG